MNFIEIPMPPMNKNFLPTCAFFEIETSFIALLKAWGSLGPPITRIQIQQHVNI